MFSAQTKETERVLSRFRQPRKFEEKDVPVLIEKMFNQFDTDGNHIFSKHEFSKVIASVFQLVGGECPNTEDTADLFNLLDINGDEQIDRKELTSLMTIFFKLLNEQNIEVQVNEETDLIF